MIAINQLILSLNSKIIVLKKGKNLETLNDMLSVAEALSHDIKGAVGTIGLKLTLTEYELRPLKNLDQKAIELLIKEILHWKEQISKIYASAEDLTKKVRKEAITLPQILSDEIIVKLIQPIDEIKSSIDTHQKVFFNITKADLTRLKEAKISVLRVNQILEGLLYDLRPDNTLQYRLTNLSAHAQRAVEGLFQIKREADADINIKGNASMKADQSSFLVLFINLIENAIKYAKPNLKPKIEILLSTENLNSLKVKHDDMFYNISSPDEWVSIIISDNGIGIPESARTLVFDMGYRVKSNGKIPGSGYGLARVKSIIRRHRGKYALETSDLGGLKFICYFPIHQNGFTS